MRVCLAVLLAAAAFLAVVRQACPPEPKGALEAERDPAAQVLGRPRPAPFRAPLLDLAIALPAGPGMAAVAPPASEPHPAGDPARPPARHHPVPPPPARGPPSSLS